MSAHGLTASAWTKARFFGAETLACPAYQQIIPPDPLLHAIYHRLMKEVDLIPDRPRADDGKVGAVGMEG